MKMSILYLCYSKKEIKTWTGPPSVAFLSSNCRSPHMVKAEGFGGSAAWSGMGKSPHQWLRFPSRLFSWRLRADSLTGRKRFPSFELPAVFSRKPFVLPPGWTGGSAPKGSLLSQRCPVLGVLPVLPRPSGAQGARARRGLATECSPRAEVAAGSDRSVNLDQSRSPGNDSRVTQLARGNAFS